MKRIDLDKKQIMYWYYNQRLSAIETAEKLGVSRTCLINNFRRYSLKFRPRGTTVQLIENKELYKSNEFRCLSCSQIQSLSGFGNNKNSWTAHNFECKKCASGRMGRVYKRSFWSYRSSSLNEKSITNYISTEELKEIYNKHKSTCYYCGRKLNIEKKKELAFDHVINGFNNKHNLVVCCQECNRKKDNSSLEELKRFVRKIEEHINENLATYDGRC